MELEGHVFGEARDDLRERHVRALARPEDREVADDDVVEAELPRVRARQVFGTRVS